jgi:hypothetical protein
VLSGALICFGVVCLMWSGMAQEARVGCLRQTLPDSRTRSNPRVFGWVPRCFADLASSFICSVLVQDVLLRQGLVCYTVADDRARREASRLQEAAARLQETVSKLREDNLQREHLLAMNALLERSIAQFNAVNDTIRRQVAEARQTEQQLLQLQEQKQQQAMQAPALAAAAVSASSGSGQAQSPALSRRVLQTLPQASAAAVGPGVIVFGGAQRKRKRSASAEPASKRRRPSPD